MEKWKIIAVAALLLSLFGFGIYQQKAGEQSSLGSGSTTAATPSASDAKPVSSFYDGKTLPNWNFKQWMNTPQPLSNAVLQGKTTLVEIFRTDCSHCQDAAPFMAAIDQRYGPRGLKMIGIQSPGDFKNVQNPENDWANVQSWAKERKLKYPIAFDEKSGYYQGTLFRELLKGETTRVLYPLIMLVGPDAKINFSHTGHDTSKAVSLAIELEKRFPTSKDLQKNAADLVKWLTANILELSASLHEDPNMAKAMTDDIAQRLK